MVSNSLLPPITEWFSEKPSQVVGDRETSTNIRYKTGKSLTMTKRCLGSYQSRKIFLPKGNLSSKYIFAKTISFGLPENYNHFVNYYKDTYQHGGISLESDNDKYFRT